MRGLWGATTLQSRGDALGVIVNTEQMQPSSLPSRMKSCEGERRAMAGWVALGKGNRSV